MARKFVHPVTLVVSFVLATSTSGHTGSLTSTTAVFLFVASIRQTTFRQTTVSQTAVCQTAISTQKHLFKESSNTSRQMKNFQTAISSIWHFKIFKWQFVKRLFVKQQFHRLDISNIFNWQFVKRLFVKQQVIEWELIKWHCVKWHFVKWHFVKWHFVKWHFIKTQFFQMTICQTTIDSCNTWRTCLRVVNWSSSGLEFK